MSDDNIEQANPLTQIPLSTPGIWWVNPSDRRPISAIRVGHPANGAWVLGYAQISASTLMKRIGDAKIHQLIGYEPEPEQTPAPVDAPLRAPQGDQYAISEKQLKFMERHKHQLNREGCADYIRDAQKIEKPEIVEPTPTPEPLHVVVRLSDSTITNLSSAIEVAVENALTNRHIGGIN